MFKRKMIVINNCENSLRFLVKSTDPLRDVSDCSMRLTISFGRSKSKKSILNNDDELDPSTSSSSHNTDSSRSINRRVRRRNSMLRCLSGAPTPRRKRVTFSTEQPAVIGTSESYHDTRDAFYTPKELSKMSSEANRLGEDVACKKDRHVITCLYHCYGFASKEGLTEEKALHYYFHYQAHDEVDELHEDDEITLRGLENLICPSILDYRMEAVQSVLALQTKLRGVGEPASPELEQKLAAVSVSISKRSKRFARLLGMADAAICGTSSSSLNRKNNHKKATCFSSSS